MTDPDPAREAELKAARLEGRIALLEEQAAERKRGKDVTAPAGRGLSRLRRGLDAADQTTTTKENDDDA